MPRTSLPTIFSDAAASSSVVSSSKTNRTAKPDQRLAVVEVARVEVGDRRAAPASSSTASGSHKIAARSTSKRA